MCKTKWCKKVYKYNRQNQKSQKTVLYMFHWVIESPSLSKTMSLLCIKTTILYVFHNHRLGLFCVCYTDQACPTLCWYCASWLLFCICFKDRPVHCYCASWLLFCICFTDWPVHCYCMCIIITILYLFHRLACSLLLCIIITLLYLFHRLACLLLLCIIRLFCVCFTEW